MNRNNLGRRFRKLLSTRLTCERLEERRLLAADTGRSEYVPDEILVQYVANVGMAQKAQARGLVKGAVAETIHTKVMQASGMGQLERVKLSQGVGVDKAIAALKNNPWVSYAEPNYIYRPSVVSNDSYYTGGSLWGMYSDDSPAAVGPAGTTNQFGSQAEKAWADGATGSSNIVVGVIDEGMQVTHPDLVDNVWVNPYETAGDGIDNDGNGYVDDIYGWDFVYNNNSVYDVGEDSHGTHVAGTIGGKGGNGAGVAGVNWNVKMISTKFLGPGGGTTANAVKAVDYLTDLKVRHGINLVASNNSWGGGGYSQTLHDAIIRHAKQNILFVAAAGNSNVNNDTGGYYPSNYNTAVGTSTETAASYDGVISVAAIDSAGNRASFSSYGATTVDIGAPGVGVWSSVPTNTYASYSGTSMATPHVTGAVALYASVQPFAPSGAALKSAILDSATPTASMAGVTVTGGRLNVYAALRQSAFLSMDADKYTLPDTIGLSVQHPAANLSSTAVDSVSVQIRSTTESSPLTVSLLETGANTGVFTGAVSMVAGSPVSGDGLLQAAHGDTITATYTPLGQTVTATIDAVAPNISGVSTTAQSLSARIAWTTDEASTTEVRYGTSASNLNLTYNSTTPVTSHSATVLGLTPLTTYYYQVASRDSSGNLSVSATAQFTTAATASILLVDDDQGATYERFFKDALTANGYTYDVWDAVAVGATPSTVDLNRYGRVVWNTGYDYSAATAGLSSGEQTAITGYLNAGGRIFIVGQDVLYNGVAASFQTNYLKVARYVNDEGTISHTESGLAGNPISNGMSLSIARPSDFPTLYVDDVTPVAGAEATFQSPWGYSTVNYRGDYANGGFGMVFMAFPFEAISTSAADPNNQKVVMGRVMDYLGTGATSPFILTAPTAYTTSEGLATATFGVRLASQPTADVTIPISSSDTTEGTVSVSSLTFTSSNWNTAQNVIVRGVNDNVDDGDIAYRVLLGAATSTDPTFSNADPLDIYLTNIDNDTAGITVSAPSSITTTEAGGTATFTVVLTSEPTASVTIPISSNDTTEGTVNVSSLVFTNADWNIARTVTVTGVNDFLDDGDIAYLAVTGAATSSDPLYSSRNAADVSLTNLDNDTAGITVSSPSSLSTTEAGGTVTFTIKLDSQPTASVTIPVSSSDTTEGTVTPASLVFTTSNWLTPQTITVTGVDDAIFDGNVVYNVLIGAASSTDALYNGLDPADITLTNIDNDNTPITVSAPSSSATTEVGGTVTFTVKLELQPTASVTIPISSSKTNEGTVSQSSLSFDSTNWNTPQTVTVTGVNDFIDDGDVAYSVVLGTVSSTDSRFTGVDPADLALTNIDDDTAGVTVSNPSGPNTTEAGGAVTFTVKLNSEPTGSVRIPLSSSDTSEGSVSPAWIDFDSSNWNVPQTVTVAGANDNVDDGDIGYSIVTGAATSSDAKYSNHNAADVVLSNLDDDTAGVTVSAPSGLFTTEAGGAVTFTVKLNSEPTGSVTIPLSSSDTTEGSVSPASLVFDSTNWSTPKTVTVTGVNDNVDDGDIAYAVVTGSATSSDTNYSSHNAADVVLSNTDDDTAGVTVSTPSATSTTEAGGAVTFTVKLNSEPTGSVTIPLSSTDTTEGSVSPASLVFDSTNWNTPKTVTVTGVNDSVDDGDIDYTILTGPVTSLSDGKYNGLSVADIPLKNIDNDTAGITVSAPSGLNTSEAGTFVTFTVRLTSEPLANVTVPISSSDTTEGTVSVGSLVFTSSNWNTPRSVTVTGVDDGTVDGNIAYSVVIGAASSMDGAYNLIDPTDISLTNLDNEGTKFFVVNDGAPDRTFEYSAAGGAVENYTINAGNTAPRGIVSSVLGDRLWVIDNNRNVYVYDNSGVHLGTWTAGSIASTATVEGIATDGTNIWIVDSKSDRIYYYSGAATRALSTTTTPVVAATSNFALNSGNKNPKDLVYGSDGSNKYLWVVDDATTDKVFRYTITASTGGITLANSWNLNASNKSPTGITLDPGATSGDLWIVDNGTTKQVFKYTNGRGVTNTTSPGSSVAFVLTGLSNPQGIADPPPMGTVSQSVQSPSLQPSRAVANSLASMPGVVSPWSSEGQLGRTAHGVANQWNVVVDQSNRSVVDLSAKGARNQSGNADGQTAIGRQLVSIENISKRPTTLVRKPLDVVARDAFFAELGKVN